MSLSRPPGPGRRTWSQEDALSGLRGGCFLARSPPSPHPWRPPSRQTLCGCPGGPSPAADARCRVMRRFPRLGKTSHCLSKCTKMHTDSQRSCVAFRAAFGACGPSPFDCRHVPRALRSRGRRNGSNRHGRLSARGRFSRLPHSLFFRPRVLGCPRLLRCVEARAIGSWCVPHAGMLLGRGGGTNQSGWSWRAGRLGSPSPRRSTGSGRSPPSCDPPQPFQCVSLIAPVVHWCSPPVFQCIRGRCVV